MRSLREAQAAALTKIGSVDCSNFKQTSNQLGADLQFRSCALRLAQAAK